MWTLFWVLRHDTLEKQDCDWKRFEYQDYQILSLAEPNSTKYLSPEYESHFLKKSRDLPICGMEYKIRTVPYLQINRNHSKMVRYSKFLEIGAVWLWVLMWAQAWDMRNEIKFFFEGSRWSDEKCLLNSLRSIFSPAKPKLISCSNFQMIYSSDFLSILGVSIDQFLMHVL